MYDSVLDLVAPSQKIFLDRFDCMKCVEKLFDSVLSNILQKFERVFPRKRFAREKESHNYLHYELI